MFHRNDDRLQRLNEELLAEEDFEEEEYEEYPDEEDELDLEDIGQLLEEEETAEEQVFYRNHANGYGADVRNFANRYGRGSQKQFDDEEDWEDDDDLEDEEFLYRDDFRRAKKNRRKAKRAEKKAKRKERKGKLGLALLALLELIAIGGIIAWWISWIL